MIPNQCYWSLWGHVFFRWCVWGGLWVFLNGKLMFCDFKPPLHCWLFLPSEEKDPIHRPIREKGESLACARLLEFPWWPCVEMILCSNQLLAIEKWNRPHKDCRIGVAKWAGSVAPFLSSPPYHFYLCIFCWNNGTFRDFWSPDIILEIRS